MRQCRRGVQNNQKGFTLIEALLQLLVFGLFVQMVLAFYFLIQQWNQVFFTDEHIKWEMFIQDFQQYLTGVEELYTAGDSLYIEESPTKIIKVNKISDVIRLQINDRGYVPLLIGIRNAKFSVSDDRVTIKVEFLNGMEKERTLFVQYAEE
ncbi:competence type IV pilus minor pilin ComGF [Ureibacillus sp. FSL K6-8385]|uniref:Competence protein ComGF n=1 Tax=Ureibacillus terrenus TaxID=118246 RepID=A0A540V6C1_9BACL|nr:competence type IV pilus minor pilin ComGF [Ureibacillus terrenus]MED3660743.1 competence type IV pilus minor pilin ComGF [Ureibacillus terrenus]MED3762930.1 competence type IV pilus minor pilin ComGF [Ureibacillus terrenus]TQE92268.1 hypothetical protein FKZ59_00750 [Ureibacillus terrenus]